MPNLIYDTWAPMTLPQLDVIFQYMNIQPDEIFCDLGSGDGLVVIDAGIRGITSIGIEIDKELYDHSIEQIDALGLPNVFIFNKDFYFEDLSEYDVLFANLSEDSYRILIDKFFASHKAGARMFLYMGIPYNESGPRRCHDCEKILFEENIEGTHIVKFTVEEEMNALLHVIMVVESR